MILFAMACGIAGIWACTKTSNEDTTSNDCNGIEGATFSSNNGKVLAIMTGKCAGSSCHSPGGKEADEFLVSSDLSGITSMLSKASSEVLDKSMPPGGGLTDSEIAVWKCWKASGYPQ